MTIEIRLSETIGVPPDAVWAALEDIETHTEIVVSPEDDIELRRVKITNRSRNVRTLELTTYGEGVLATPAADAMQPSFGNLFVQTEIVRDRHAILCTRRRSIKKIVCLHNTCMMSKTVQIASPSQLSDLLKSSTVVVADCKCSLSL